MAIAAATDNFRPRQPSHVTSLAPVPPSLSAKIAVELSPRVDDTGRDIDINGAASARSPAVPAKAVEPRAAL